jgi:hypothetical protein
MEKSAIASPSTNQMSLSHEIGIEEPIPIPIPTAGIPTNSDPRKALSLRPAVVQKDSEETLSPLPDLEIDLEHGEGTELKRKPSTVIPRRKRRGLFASVVIGIPEIEDPVQYSNKIKGFILFIIATAAVAAPMGFVSIFCLDD